MTSPRQNRPQSSAQSGDGSQKRILVYIVLLVVGVLYLLFRPSPHEAEVVPAPATGAEAPASSTAVPVVTAEQNMEECKKQIPGVIGYPAAQQSSKEKFCGCVSDAALKAAPSTAADARDAGIRACFTEILHEAPPASATRNMPAAPQVSEADLANIPADRRKLLDNYCNAMAYKKAEEYRVDPQVFIKLNANYIRTCVLMQSKPSQPVAE